MKKLKIPALLEKDGGEYQAKDLASAHAFCKSIALGRYENFPVGSLLIKKTKRKHFFAAYSFARFADDIADEPIFENSREKIAALEKLETALNEIDEFAYAGNPIFLALKNSIDDAIKTKAPFRKLLEAFKMDAEFKRPKTWEDVYYYCERSANPVGEIVLRISDSYDESAAKYSDMICTGLQLANFWQDFSVDLPNGRCYVPEQVLEKYALNEKNNLQNLKKTSKFSVALDELCGRTDDFLTEGSRLVPLLKDFRLRTEIKAIVGGGLAISKKTRALGSEILQRRPKLSKFDFAGIFLKSFLPYIELSKSNTTRFV